MIVEINKKTDKGQEYISSIILNCTVSDTLIITQALLLLAMDETAHKDTSWAAEELRKEIILSAKI